jgi:hypothetical protein
VTGLLLAQATSDNAHEGAYLTLWFPLGLFIIVIAVLWRQYTLPHRRIPPPPPAHAQPGGAANRAGTRAAPGRRDAPEGSAAETSAPAAGQPGEPRLERPGYTASGRAGTAGHGPDDSGESGAQRPPGEGTEAGE